MGRQPRSRLDLVYPDLSTQVTIKIDNAKITTDKIVLKGCSILEIPLVW